MPACPGIGFASSGIASPRSLEPVQIGVQHHSRFTFGSLLGVHHETLRKRVRQTEFDEGKRYELLSSEERERLKALEHENRELRRANEILKSTSAFFAAELDLRRTK